MCILSDIKDTSVEIISCDLYVWDNCVIICTQIAIMCDLCDDD